MTLKEIFEFIEPLLIDDAMAQIDAKLIIVCADGELSFGDGSKNETKLRTLEDKLSSLLELV